MAGQESKFREEIQKLIKTSCDFDSLPNEKWKKFHQSFLKLSFVALKIEIDYKNKTILIWNSKPSTANSIELYKNKEALIDRVSYTDLEETLLGCLEIGAFNERFYKYLLNDSNNFQFTNELRIA